MNQHNDVLARIANLPARERAAALGHWIYMQTTNRENVDWKARVDSAWHDLDQKAREFNLAAIDTWATSPEVLAAWFDALKEYRDTRK
jgi:hypothetical protein